MLAREPSYFLSQSGVLLTKLVHELLEFFPGRFVTCHVLRLAQKRHGRPTLGASLSEFSRRPRGPAR